MTDLSVTANSKIINIEDKKRSMNKKGNMSLKFEPIVKTGKKVTPKRKNENIVKSTDSLYVKGVKSMNKFLAKETLYADLTRTTLKFQTEENNVYYRLSNYFMNRLKVGVNEYVEHIKTVKTEEELKRVKMAFSQYYESLKEEFIDSLMETYLKNEARGYIKEVDVNTVKACLDYKNISSILFSFFQRLETVRGLVDSKNERWENKLLDFSLNVQKIYMEFVDKYIDDEDYMAVDKIIDKKMDVYSLDSLKKIYCVYDEEVDFAKCLELAYKEVEYIFVSTIKSYQEFKRNKDINISNLWASLGEVDDEVKRLQLQSLIEQMNNTSDMVYFKTMEDNYKLLLKNDKRGLK